MVLASKVAGSGIVCLLLMSGISGPRPTPLASEANVNKEVSTAVQRNHVRKIQQALQDKGQFGGKVDGVFGLRTRASIRGFQKAENLPVTGQLDTQTAGRLGVRPEGRQATGYEVTQSKPSAGIKRNKGSRRISKTLRKVVETPTRTVPPA